MAANQTSPQIPPVVYATFSGMVNHLSLDRIFSGFTNALASKTVQHVHLAFQTSGGFIGDGIALYNYFKALPIGLTIYNTETVASIGVIAYLGAKARKASKHSSFMIHRSYKPPGGNISAGLLKSSIEQIGIDDKRVEAILREHLTMSNNRWADLDHHDIHFSAEDAVKAKIADSIAEFSPPADAQLFHITAQVFHPNAPTQ